MTVVHFLGEKVKVAELCVFNVRFVKVLLQ